MSREPSPSSLCGSHGYVGMPARGGQHVGHLGRGPYRRVTPRRLETFVRELRAGATLRAAAAAASPGSRAGALATFRTVMRDDPRFACAVVAARVGTTHHREHTPC